SSFLGSSPELAEGDQAIQSGAETGDGAGTVAELVLHQCAEFAEGLVIFGDQEEWVVPEPMAASGLAGDPASARARGLGADLSAGVGQGERADKRGATPLIRLVGEGFEDLPVVGLVVAVTIRVSRRKDARGAAEDVDGEAGIVGQDPVAQHLGG